MIKFQAFRGIITSISDSWTNNNEELAGCFKMISVENEEGNIVNFTAGPNTYFVKHVMVHVGDRVTGYYDANAPAILIYPPQFGAIVMAKDTPYYNVKADYFDSGMVSSDGRLKLNIRPGTRIVLQNGQTFNLNPANRYLVAVYGASTKSIPAQTIPYEIIVMCISSSKN